MNSFTNSFLVFFSIPLICICIYIGMDVPIDFMHITGSEIPFQNFIFIGFGMLYFILLIWRSIRRWMGMHIVNKTTRFSWNEVVSNDRKQRIIVYTLLEVLIMSSLASALYFIMGSNRIPGIILYAFSLESLIFLLVGLQNKFRVGISSRAVIVADREVTVVYFSGLQKITIGNESIYFDYIKDLQLSFPTDCIDSQLLDSFKSGVREMIDKDKVLIRNKN